MAATQKKVPADFTADQTAKASALAPAKSSKEATAAVPAKKEPEAKKEVTVDLSKIHHEGVYSKRQARVEATDAKLDYDPAHKFANTRFVAGVHVPQRETSVMGTVHGMVKAAGSDGILGKDLAAQLRRYESATPGKSAYLQGLRPIGWAEGYIVGAEKAEHIKIVAEK